MLERKAELLQAMGHSTRLEILALLARGDRCVCDIQAALEEPQPNVSRHLGILRHAGLVRAKRAQNRVVYGLADPRVARLLGEVDTFVVGA